eukprot:TRINITY_DN9369_c0_g1_i1.p1 TRINITY_DN9369_c0_g1~~TRINITY_DN9369_c0_g1_i1.p1  ORF type:complete len:343 (-),score=71.56 TRINITY_DN9369_c0_g1_i1:689-1717(-)
MQQQQQRKKEKSGGGGIWSAFVNYMGLDGGQLDSRNVIQINSKYEIGPDDFEPTWIPLNADKSYPVSGVVLSLWDNLSGPRVEQVWYDSQIPRELLLQSATFTLNGEMLDMGEGDSEEKLDRVEHKFLMLPQYFSACILFCAYFNGQLTKFSLSCIFSTGVVDRMFCMLNIVMDRLRFLAGIYKEVSSQSSEAAMTALELALPPMLANFSALATVRLDPPMFSSSLLAAATSLPNEVQTFFSTVLTSHLQTGSTVVIGPNAQRVEAWVVSLAPFLLEDQRRLARAQVLKGIQNFVPDLCLQGLQTQPGEKLDDEQILFSLTPTTLVDLHSLSVKQTHPYHEF